MIAFLLLCISVLFLFVGWYSIRFLKLLRISEGLINHTEKYTLPSSDTSYSLLVLGDSTAFGVGASRKEESLPALLAHTLGATFVENRGVSGAVVHGVWSQLEGKKQDHYDTILLMIGGNDMTRLHNLDTTSDEFSQIISHLPKHRNLIVTSCGNLGGAKIFPWFVGRYYEHISRQFHAGFAQIVEAAGGYYVPIFDERAVDPFIREPQKYLAADLFHPSSEGYAYWFSKIDFSKIH